MAKSAEVRASTASALGLIGEEAKSAAPALLITAKDQDQRVHNNSLWALRQVRADPGLVLPAMIAALEDPYSAARENAAIALAQYGPVASNAIPVLLRTMHSNDVALHALQKIAPEQVPRVQLK
jgi:HEAT repeat protein